MRPDPISEEFEGKAGRGRSNPLSCRLP
jgi:hypothetical protein